MKSKQQQNKNAGLYYRLSKDDERAGESLSIENQKLMLRKYAAEQGFTVIDEYIDDGWSGTNFNRPEVKRLLEDAKAGRPCLQVTDTVKAGINVALGTGGAPDSGSCDLFETMRALALAERQRAGKPDAMPAPALLTMATVCGALAQRRTDCGTLEVGKDADLALVDFSAPHLMPSHNVLSSLVFSAKGGDVAMTMVRGKILYQNGQFPTLDLRAAVEELMTYGIPRLFGNGK